MSNKIVLKKSSVASKVPLTGDLVYGEMAINYADGKLYFKDSSNNISYFKSGDYSVSVTNDTSTNGDRYLLWDDQTSGSISSVGVSTTKLKFNPSSGRFQATGVGAASGVLEMANSVSANYAIAAGYNAISAGPMTIEPGAELTIPDGSVWTVV